MLADSDLSDLYESLDESSKAVVLKPAAAFLRKWYDDPQYEDRATIGARARLRESILLELQGSLPLDPDNPG